VDSFASVILETEICPYLTIQTDWVNFFHTRMKRKSRYNILRQIKQLQSQGRLEFKMLTQADNWGSFINRAIKLYQKDWNKKYNISSFLRDGYTDFYIDIAQEFSKRGWFCFSYLLLNEEMIAFSYGITYKNIFIDYLIGYDPKFSVFSPGGCLLRFQVEEIFTQNLKEFDFSKGREPYKSRWQTAERKNYRIIISNNDFYSKLIWLLHILYHRIRYTCKSSYTLRKLRKHLLGHFR
jgi:CelD/BcsL family acetyltransferase involved in cellulose biosynthesis